MFRRVLGRSIVPAACSASASAAALLSRAPQQTRSMASSRTMLQKAPQDDGEWELNDDDLWFLDEFAEFAGDMLDFIPPEDQFQLEKEFPQGGAGNNGADKK